MYTVFLCLLWFRLSYFVCCILCVKLSKLLSNKLFSFVIAQILQIWTWFLLPVRCVQNRCRSPEQMLVIVNWWVLSCFRFSQIFFKITTTSGSRYPDIPDRENFVKRGIYVRRWMRIKWPLATEWQSGSILVNTTLLCTCFHVKFKFNCFFCWFW